MGKRGYQKVCPSKSASRLSPCLILCVYFYVHPHPECPLTSAQAAAQAEKQRAQREATKRRIQQEHELREAQQSRLAKEEAANQ